jgi:hypothetical protein
MPVTEDTPRQLVLKSGSTTLTLDKDAGKATLQRKLLIWRLKPIEARRDQCVCNPRLSGAPDLALPSVGTVVGSDSGMSAEKFHVQEQPAGGMDTANATHRAAPGVRRLASPRSDGPCL